MDGWIKCWVVVLNDYRWARLRGGYAEADTGVGITALPLMNWVD